MIDALSSFAGKLAAGPIASAPRVAPQLGPGSSLDFGATLSQVTANAIQSMKSAETTSLAGLEGKASAQKVVEAVLAAEHSLQTAIAIRDKVVNSYTELTRMAI